MRSVDLELDLAKVRSRLTLSNAVFSWCVRRAEIANKRSCVHDALEWSIIAGEIAEGFGSNRLASSALEQVLTEAARFIPASPASTHETDKNKIKWLHVLSRAYETGGHTALCKRWITLDPTGDQHSVALTFQDQDPPPRTLSAAVSERGGYMEVLSEDRDLLRRAERLRILARKADVVVLHTHMWDPLPVVSFSDLEMPPVLLVNHADHTYWTGGSVADLILNIRPSGEALCRSHRGKARSFRLPLPLLPLQENPCNGEDIRSSLGIPPDAIVFLTVGSAYKYKPTANLNFVEVAKQLLDGLPQAYLLAIGPKPDHTDWASAKASTGGRLIALGEKTDLPRYYAAADIYLEGFPFGSLTALLEAVQSGLPPVLAPAQVPLPYRSDDYSLADTNVPSDTSDYVSIAFALAQSTQATRRSNARLLGAAVASIHCEPDWSSHLLRLRNCIASGEKHVPSPLGPIPELPEEVALYWARFLMQRNPNDNPYSYAIRRAQELGLEYRLDHRLMAALSKASRAGLPVPKPSLESLQFAAAFFLPRRFHQVAVRAARKIDSYIRWRITKASGK